MKINLFNIKEKKKLKNSLLQLTNKPATPEVTVLKLVCKAKCCAKRKLKREGVQETCDIFFVEYW